MPKITIEDLDRIVGEYLMVYDSPEDWMRKNNFPFQALEDLTDMAVESYLKKVGKGMLMGQAFCETVSNAFVLGWECGHQLGRAAQSDN